MEEPEDNNLLRRYLLGDLPEAEQWQVEESFVVDSAFREHLLIVEDQVIEDYLDETLTEQDRSRFEKYFLATPQQQRRVRIARALRKHVVAVTDLNSITPAKDLLPEDERPRKRLQWLSWRNPFVLIPTAAGLLLVVALGVVKLNEIRRLREAREQAHRRRAAIEQELAQINDPKRIPEGSIFPVVLVSVSVRNTQSPNKFAVPKEGTVVELRLVLEGDNYPHYRAGLRRMDEPEPVKIPNLRSESTPSGRAVLVRIPSHLLARGNYRLILTGITAAGEDEMEREYDFEVSGNP